MSISASNLSDPKYGYDLVCSVSQSAINQAMRAFLSGFNASFGAYYTYDPATKQTVLTPLQTIVDAIGGDPFSIPDQSDQSHPMVQALYEKCKFRFGFRATMGLPSVRWDQTLPPIVVLDRVGQSVTYRLYCADFAYLNLLQFPGETILGNMSQDPADPWTFTFTVDLDMRPGDENAFNKLPPRVQARIKDLDPDSMFSIQQLYLDLNSRALESLPQMGDITAFDEAYTGVTSSFINQYWENLGADGIVLGYGVKSAAPAGATPSVVPTDLNIEVSPHLDAEGKPSHQYDFYTLNYLVMSEGRPMPAPTTFGWNWVDEWAGGPCVIAIRRDLYLDFVRGLVNQDIGTLCISPNVTLSHDGLDYTYRWSYAPSSAPTQFEKVPIGATSPGAFTKVMTFSYSQSSHDDSEDSLRTSSIHGDFNYAIDGKVEFVPGTFQDNRAYIRITLHAVAYFAFSIHELGVTYAIVDGNGLDLTHVVTYDFGVTRDGQLLATPYTDIIGGAQALNYGSHGIIDTDTVRDYVTNVSNGLLATVTGLMTGYGDSLTDMIDNSHAWVVPGGRTFTYNGAIFSSSLDLLTFVDYADPS